jgi:hypothetical protein
MKTIQYFFFVALGCVLMAADCSNKDSEFYNDVYITTPDLVQIEALPSYAVNDVLWINSNAFSRYTPEAGQANALDVYKTTGGAPSFNFSYVLERRISAEEWGVVTLNNNLLQDKGISEETDVFIGANCIYNAASETYDFRSGMRLTQAGEYRLSFGYNSTNTTSVELRSDTIGNNLFLNINSLCSALDGAGYYNFTVVE